MMQIGIDFFLIAAVITISNRVLGQGQFWGPIGALNAFGFVKVEKYWPAGKSYLDHMVPAKMLATLPEDLLSNQMIGDCGE